jgi:intein/homing endonuclease
MSMFGDARDRIVNILVGDTSLPSKQAVARSHMLPDVQVGLGDAEVYNLYDWFQDNTSVERDLASRYMDYERMDDYPDSASSLDTYADEATQSDQMRKLALWYESPNDMIQKRGMQILRNLGVEDDLWAHVRGLVKYGNCLPAGTRVWTEFGPRPIETVSGGDRVLGYKDGEAALFTVVKRHDNGAKDVFRVRTKHREFFATANHPVMVQRDNGVGWVRVRDLKVVRWSPSGGRKTGGINYSKTPKLVIATAMPDPAAVASWEELYGQQVVPKKRETGGNVLNGFDVPPVEPWVCRLMGFLWGDGWIATERMDSGNSTVAYARGVYPDQNDYYDSLLERMALKPKVSSSGALTQVHSVLFKCFLLSLGWQNGATKKRVPMWLGRLPAEFRKAFLDGFLDADGWATSPPTRNDDAVHFEIANAELAGDLKALVDGLGYRSGNLRYRHRKPARIAGNEVHSSHQTATLTFSWHKCDPGFVAETLLEVLPVGKEPVYDLQVDDEAHNFVADGVVVHNSYGELIINQEGVQGIEYMDPPTVRVASIRGQVVGYVQDVTGQFSVDMRGFQAALQGGTFEQGNMVFFEPLEVVHWKLMLRRLRGLYGHGVLEPVRWLHKRLVMLEDSAILFKITRAPVRLAYYVACGDIPAERRIGYVTQIKQMFRRKKYKDVDGKLRFSFDPRNPLEEFWLPAGGEHGDTRIEAIGGSDYQCLHGDTKIPLADGTRPTMKELVCKYGGTDDRFGVLSIDSDQHVTIGKAYHPRVTGRKVRLWGVTLDNGRTEKCTDTHPWMLRDGTYCRTDELQAGDSLMPFYVRESSKKDGDRLDGYPMVFDPRDDKYLYLHQVAWRAKSGSLLPRHGCVIHHVDFDKWNGDPSNLVEMERGEHARLHVAESGRLHTPEVKARARAAHNTEAYKCKMSRIRRELLASDHVFAAHCGAVGVRLADHPARRSGFARAVAEGRIGQTRGEAHSRWRADVSPEVIADLLRSGECKTMGDVRRRLGCSQSVYERVIKSTGSSVVGFMHANGVKNHRVVSVCRLDEWADVYDLSVEEHSNFALDAGAFVHNSTELLDYMQGKYHNAIKVPRFHMGYGGEPARSLLANQDVRFARAILRVQRAECTGWERVLDVDMMARNIDPSTVDRKAMMTVPSSIFELARMEVWNSRADLMTRIGEWMPIRWMLVNIVRMSDEEAAVLMKEKADERRSTMVGDAQAQAKADRIMQGNIPQEGLTLTRKELGDLVVQSIAREPGVPGRDEKRLLAKIEEAMAADPALARRIESMAGMVKDLHRVTMSGIQRGSLGRGSRR